MAGRASFNRREVDKPLAERCGEVTGKRDNPGNAVRKIDINGAGRPAYLFYACGEASLLRPERTTACPRCYSSGSVRKVWSEDTWAPDEVTPGKTANTFMRIGRSCCGAREGSPYASAQAQCGWQMGDVAPVR